MISAPIFRVSFIGVCLMTILCGAQAADVWLDAGYNAPGTPFVAQLHVSDVSDLYGLAFEVLYDTGAVSVPDADANGANGVSAKIVEGDLLNQNGTAQALGAARLPQGQAGRIVAGYSRTGQAAGVDAPDDIFVVGLTVQTTGVTPGTMSLAGVYLEDAAGDPIPLTVLPTVANRNLGTVAVDVTPDAASWTFLDGDGVEHNGTGDQTVTDVHTGEIVLTWDELDPFETPTPNPVTQTLVRDGTVTFSGDYGVGPGFGTVIVTPNAGRAPWVFYDSGGQAHSGTGIATVTDVPSGNIFMVWHYLDGFEQPAPSQEQQVLAPNDTVTFTATYTPYFGFVKVNVTPDTARWTLKDKTGQEQGGQGDQSVVMHAGAVTIHWGLADDHVPPYLVEETRALPRGGQITFEAVYAASSTAQWLAGFGYNDGWRAARHIRTFADVTGDGMADVVGIGDNGVLVARSTGSSFGAASVWTLGFGSKAGWDKERHPRVLADVNGDGRADVVGFGDQGVTVAPSIGTQFAAPALWTKGFGFEAGWQADRHPRFVQDVSGDGMADIVGFGDQGVTVAVSSGYDFQAPALWVQGFGYNDFWMMDRHPRMIADVNGDGRGDVAGFADKGIMVALSTGSGFGAPGLWVEGLGYSDGWTIEQNPRLFARLNRDDRLDAVGFGSRSVLACVSAGGGLYAAQSWVDGFGSKEGWQVGQHPRYLGDLDADGRDDVIGFYADGVRVALSTGSNFGIPARWVADFGQNQGWDAVENPRLPADVNGDGRMDAAGFSSNGVVVCLSAFTAPPKRTSAEMWTLYD